MKNMFCSFWSQQAPVPYLNRAISKEALGVQAAASGDSSRALDLWQSAAADCDRAIEVGSRRGGWLTCLHGLAQLPVG